jgi:hypothetical protein
MRYKPNLWTIVDRIQTAPDTRNSVYPRRDDMRKTETTNVPKPHSRDAWELKNSFRL